ncbi:hypothetical protein OHA61_17465 [Streptomyces sp. NBC_00885]|uniref:hypothetical protein n=1 Tax=Streptomyces sp. NBC_00885 TaxID=2975857 RepID=UPI003866B755|nr:hypothetical protein OHA61_17465 [Streptomyces sp. NBC_00885]
MRRPRLALRYHPAWYSHPTGKRPIGPRPMLGLHRTPDPECPACCGWGEVATGNPYCEEPGFYDCPCAPFLPLVKLWLPKWADTTRYRRIKGVYSDSPPF